MDARSIWLIWLFAVESKNEISSTIRKITTSIMLLYARFLQVTTSTSHPCFYQTSSTSHRLPQAVFYVLDFHLFFYWLFGPLKGHQIFQKEIHDVVSKCFVSTHIMCTVWCVIALSIRLHFNVCQVCQNALQWSALTSVQFKCQMLYKIQCTKCQNVFHRFCTRSVSNCFKIKCTACSIGMGSESIDALIGFGVLVG